MKKIFISVKYKKIKDKTRNQWNKNTWTIKKITKTKTSSLNPM